MKLQQSIHRRQNHPRSAFSFIELLIVMMLLGIMAGIAAPRYQAAINSTHIEVAAKRLAADLRRARAGAIQKATAHTIAFHVGNSTYSSSDLSDLDHPEETLVESVGRGGFMVQMTSADFGGMSTITFDWRGEPSFFGSVDLAVEGLTATVSVTSIGNVEVAF